MRRYLLTRCAYCGGRFSWGYVPVEVPGFTKDELKWWQGEPDLVHYEKCASIALLVMKYRQICGPEKISMRYERSMHWYYGSYPWYREAVLGESYDVSLKRAEEHVQRSLAPCSTCHGDKEIVIDGVPKAGTTPPYARDDIDWVVGLCEGCEGTGHERVEDPVPNELILEAA